MLNNIYNFIYIGVIILGGITLTLSLILNAKERDKQHRGMFLFASTIFFYMISDFVTYYFLGQGTSGKLVFTFITISDILFALLVIAWLYQVSVFMRSNDNKVFRWAVTITVIYTIGSQFLSIMLGRFDSYKIYVESGTGKVTLQVINTLYVLTMILFCTIYIVNFFKNNSHYKEQKRSTCMCVGFSGAFIAYMIWVGYWDYSTWYKPEENLVNIYAVDPLILLYAILNVALIYYFYKSDPLKIGASQLAPHEAVMMLSERYGLTDRERQVLELLNDGKGNAQIAVELSIAENTVKRHINNIFKKTETQSRYEIIYKLSITK